MVLTRPTLHPWQALGKGTRLPLLLLLATKFNKAIGMKFALKPGESLRHGHISLSMRRLSSSNRHHFSGLATCYETPPLPHEARPLRKEIGARIGPLDFAPDLVRKR